MISTRLFDDQIDQSTDMTIIGMNHSMIHSMKYGKPQENRIGEVQLQVDSN